MSSLYLVYRLPAIEFGHFFKANVDKPTPDSCVIIPLSHLSSFFVCSHTSHPLSLKLLLCFLLLFDRWLHCKNDVDIAYRADPRLIVKRNKYSKRNHGSLFHFRPGCTLNLVTTSSIHQTSLQHAQISHVIAPPSPVIKSRAIG